MSRFKPQATITRIRADYDDLGSPQVIQSGKNISDRPPEIYPPIENFPRPPVIDDPKLIKLIECSRFLTDHFQYSGFYLVPTRSKSSENISSRRYSDRYRRIKGKRNFFDEINQPSAALFPSELLRGQKRSAEIDRFFACRRNFLSSTAEILDRAKKLTKKIKIENENGNAEEEEGEEKEPAEIDEEAKGRDRASGDEESENLSDSEVDEMDGGDYLEQYEDDDDEGDGDYGYADEGGTM